jgi:hypothetical protein
LVVSYNKFWTLAGVFLLLYSCVQEDTVTFAEDIAPIIHEHCTPCHRPNGGGPFRLLEYRDVAKRSQMVAHVTQIRYMPPWPAAHGFGDFKNTRRLNEDDIKKIAAWHKQGAKAGDTGTLRYRDVLERLEKQQMPDLIVPLQKIPIKGNHRDRFYVTQTPLTLPEDKYVRMVEFIPGVASLVHHVNGHILNYHPDDPIQWKQNVSIIDVEDPDFDVQFEKMGIYTPGFILPERIHSAVNYLPGLRGVSYPPGIGGFKLNKRSNIIFKDIHFGPSDVDTVDRSFLHFYFTEHPPNRPIKETMLGTNGISPIEPPLIIPPNTQKTFVTKAFIPETISVLSVNPHMHLLGNSIKAFALKPNGDTIPLIYIPRWDFKWQYVYTYKKMVKIPKGSTIIVEAMFDNTSQNPNNPFSPPREVSERLNRGGASMRTTDEMLQFIISYLPYEDGDENTSLTTENE